MWFNIIANIIYEKTGYDISKISLQDTFYRLGLDSLDTVEMIMNFEEKYDIEIDELDIITVKDLVNTLDKKVGNSTEAKLASMV